MDDESPSPSSFRASSKPDVGAQQSDQNGRTFYQCSTGVFQLETETRICGDSSTVQSPQTYREIYPFEMTGHSFASGALEQLGVERSESELNHVAISKLRIRGDRVPKVRQSQAHS